MLSWLLQPIIDFLKEEGLWEQTQSVLAAIQSVMEKLFAWAGTNGVTASMLYEWFIAFWKFVFKLIIIFADIIISGIQWIAEKI